MSKPPKLPDIPEQERTPLVIQLLEAIHYQMEVIQSLRDEIAVLKGNKPKPDIKPGKMEKGPKGDKDKTSQEKRPGSAKKSKTDKLPIHALSP